MPRTLLTSVAAAAPYATAPIDVTPLVVSDANNNSCQCTGKELILIRNPTGGSLTATVLSAVDPYGRTGDQTVSIPTLKTYAFGPFPVLGWKQTDGLLWINAAAALTILVLTLP